MKLSFAIAFLGTKLSIIKISTFRNILTFLDFLDWCYIFIWKAAKCVIIDGFPFNDITITVMFNLYLDVSGPPNLSLILRFSLIHENLRRLTMLIFWRTYRLHRRLLKQSIDLIWLLAWRIGIIMIVSLGCSYFTYRIKINQLNLICLEIFI